MRVSGFILLHLIVIFFVASSLAEESLSPRHLTTDTFESNTTEHTLVKFFAPWCGHCTMMAPAFQSLARRVYREWSGAHVAEVNGDAEQELVRRFNIAGYPTLVLVHNGKIVTHYHGPKEEQSMFEFMKQRIPTMKMRPNVVTPHDRCLNVARKKNGAHAECDGQKRGFGPGKAIDGVIKGYYGTHGELSYSGWSWGGDLSHAMFLVAFDKIYEITRIKIFSGVGFVDLKITAFRILYCDRKGGAYFNGYEAATCWKPIPNVTVANDYNSDGEQLYKLSKEAKATVEVKRGVSMVELSCPPLKASGVSVTVLGTDSANNDGVLSEIEVYTEPLCSWFDGCSRHERFLIDEAERIKQEEIRNLTKQIKAERAAENAKVAIVEEAKANLTRAAEEMLEQAEIQFKVSNLKGEYGAYGLLQRAKDKFEEAGLLQARTKSLEELEAKYRQAIESEEARRKAEEAAKAKAKADAEAERAKAKASEGKKKKKKNKKPKDSDQSHSFMDEEVLL
uniref:Thioredoxin domain-containing protein n=1 Tax=Guillardia theta TaxID=55529 RepID=A0A7S4PPN9_GUITH|mmetsp:Transcript_8616/g.28752  ORF Transcript_8616/g.28752 Transcript_8616/m.28752 type:complete len:507 (+) Transcript_8616:59-1579(+)